MTEYGAVLAVNVVTLGDEAVGVHAAGATTIQLDDAADFPASGSVSTPLGVLAYTAVDYDLNTLTLAAGLPAGGLADQDRVDVWDAQRGRLASEVHADVVLEGSSENSEPLDAIVQHSLIPYLPEGIRNPGGGEQVEIAQLAEGGLWFVVNVPGLSPRAVILDPLIQTSDDTTAHLEIGDDVSNAWLRFYGGNYPAQTPGQVAAGNDAATSFLNITAPDPAGTFVAVPSVDLNGSATAGQDSVVLSGTKINHNGITSLSGQPTIRRTNAASGMVVGNSTDTGVLFGTNLVTGPRITVSGGTLPTGHVFTLQEAGLYLIVTSVIWDATVTAGRRVLQIWQNGAQVAKHTIAGNGPTNMSHQLVYLMQAAANDTMKVVVWQNSGGNVNILQDDSACFLNVAKIQ